jgi:hypothetical protein
MFMCLCVRKGGESELPKAGFGKGGVGEEGVSEEERRRGRRRRRGGGRRRENI